MPNHDIPRGPSGDKGKRPYDKNRGSASSFVPRGNDSRGTRPAGEKKSPPRGDDAPGGQHRSHGTRNDSAPEDRRYGRRDHRPPWDLGYMRPEQGTDEEKRNHGRRDQRPQGQGYRRDDRPQGQGYRRDDRPQGQGYRRDDRPQGQGYRRDDRPQGQGYRRDDRPQGQGYRKDDRPQGQGYRKDDRPQGQGYRRNERPDRDNNNGRRREEGYSGGTRQYSRREEGGGSGRSYPPRDKHRAPEQGGREDDRAQRPGSRQDGQRSQRQGFRKDGPGPNKGGLRQDGQPARNREGQAFPAQSMPENAAAREDALPYLVMGRNAVRETLRAGRSINHILVVSEPDGSLRELTALARDRNIQVREVPKATLDEMCMPFGHGSKTGNHQGIVAQVPGVEYCDVGDILDHAKSLGQPPFILLLDGIEDPHNLGSIIRSAECAGVHGIIIPKRRSASVTAAVTKASAGAVAYMRVARVANLANAMDRLKQANVWIAGAHLQGVPMDEAPLEGAIALVIGSEGEGLSRLAREKCDFLVSIPLRGKIESLNAAVAAAVLLYAKLAKDGTHAPDKP